MNIEFPHTFRSDEEAEEGRAAITSALGDDSTALGWLNRLIRHKGGPWKLRIMSPQVDLRDWGGALYDKPWLAPGNLLTVVVREYDLVEGAALLRGPSNPEAELHRRALLMHEHEERERQKMVDELKRQEAEKITLEATRLMALEFRHAEWYALPPSQQALALVALALEDAKEGIDPVSMLRWHVMNNMKPGGVNLAPRRRWW